MDLLSVNTDLLSVNTDILSVNRDLLCVNTAVVLCSEFNKSVYFVLNH